MSSLETNKMIKSKIYIYASKKRDKFNVYSPEKDYTIPYRRKDLSIEKAIEESFKLKKNRVRYRNHEIILEVGLTDMTGEEIGDLIHDLGL